MSTIVVSIGYALWFMFPAYCANAVPVIMGGGYSLDGGRVFLDRKPIFGSHKTIRGFLSGLFVGTMVGILQTILFNTFLFEYSIQLQYNVLLGFMLSLGALVGDLLESFIKRRLDLPPGSSLPVADQLDFVVGALLFSVPVSPPPILSVIIIIVITIPIHFLTNVFAAFLNLKRSSGEQ